MTNLFSPNNKQTRFSDFAEMGKAALRAGLFMSKLRFAVFD